MARSDFFANIPEDCKKAISELKRLKVYRLSALDDYVETFADVWWAVLHEVDLYEEGEFCQEASRCCGECDPQAMNFKQAKTADNWLIRWNDLAIKYSQPEMLSDYHREVLGDWGDDGIMIYGGQL